MTVIGVSDISVSFGIKKILDRVSFSLEEGDKLGVIGVNGCGKSTLFKVLTSDLDPDEGQVFVSGNKTVGIVKQDDAFDVDETAGDSALSQMIAASKELLRAEAELAKMEQELQRREGEAGSAAYTALVTAYTEKHTRFVENGGLEFRARAASLLARMGFDEEMASRPLATLSGGQRTRLALARQLAREPDILLLDEPTNHLDIETLSWLEGFLAQYKKCVIVISHDRYFLDRVTNKTLVLEYAKAALYNGGYTASSEQRKIDREIAERHYKNQQREIARQEAYIAQQRAWNRERNIIAAESRQKALDRMEKLERPKEAPRAIRMSFQEASASGNEVLDVRSLSKSFDGNTLFSELSFLLKKSDRMFITGPNGCGKSTLLKIILGKERASAGRFEMGYNVEIGYYDQENQNLTPENTVLDELWNAYPTLTETEIRNTLALFRFIGEDVFRTVSVLSGGERARLTLAKLILSKMNLLVLDEPTNHLDIDSREALEEALCAFDGTVLAVSHDRYFVDKLATRVLALRPETSDPYLDYQVTHTGRGYTEFLTFAAARAETHPKIKISAATAASTGKADYLARKQSAAEERREKARVGRLKKEAEALENELAAIEEELFGSAASDYTRAAPLDARKTEAEERLLEIYEEIGV